MHSTFISIKPPPHSMSQFSSKFTNTLTIKQPTQGSTWDWIIPKLHHSLRPSWTQTEYGLHLS